MRHYSCDVCGEPMPFAYERGNKRPDGPAGICKLDDICARCIRVGKNLPVRETLLEKWLELVRTTPVEAEDAPDLLREKKIKPTAKRGGVDKSAILSRLLEFRGDPPRLGCWNELSAATKGKVTPEELRDITIEGTTPSADVWRLIEKGLDKLEGAGE